MSIAQATRVYSPNPVVQAQIERLLSWGLPPLPFAVTGTKKPPAWVDANGQAHVLKNHQDYIERMPTHEELSLWFAHTQGIGTLSGISGAWCLDIDAKHFASREDCENAVTQWRDSRGAATEGYLDRTGGGGFRELVICADKPNLYKIALTPNGKAIGELLGFGAFAVLSPSPHPSGGSYSPISHLSPITLESWDDARLYAPEQPKPIQVQAQPRQSTITTTQPQSEYETWLTILDCVDPDCEFADWFKIGAAGKAIAGESAKADWIEWSKRGSKYSGDRNLNARWAKMGYGSLGAAVNIGKKYGYRSPLAGYTPEQKQEYWQTRKRETWRELRRFTPDLITEGKYFELPEHLLSGDQSIAVRAGLGSGKTQQLLKVRKNREHGGYLVNARNSLQYQILSRFEAQGLPARHIRKDGAFGILQDAQTVFGCCPDTFYRVEDQDIRERDLYLDEWSGTVEHLLLAGTLGSRQRKAIDKIEHAAKTSEKMLILDGNLKDFEVEYLRKVSGKNIVKIKHKGKPVQRNFYFVEGVNSLLEMAYQPGSNVFIVTDSKRKSRALQEEMSERGKIGYIINSDTIGEDYAVQFTNNPRLFIEERKPDYICITPTCVSGLSVETQQRVKDAIGVVAGHFDKVLAFFHGVLLADSLHQILIRLRDNVPVYINCPEVAFATPKWFPKGTNPEEVKKQFNNLIKQNYNILERRLMSDKAKGLGDEQIEHNQKLGVILESADQMIERADDISFDALCKLVAIHNYERTNLLECLKEVLRDEGHNVENLDEKPTESNKDGLSKVAAKIDVMDTRKTISSRILETEEADRIKRSETVKEDDRYALKRFYIDSKAPGIFEAEWFNQPINPKKNKEAHKLGIQTEGEHIIMRQLKGHSQINSIETFLLLSHPEIRDLKHDSAWFKQIYAGDEFKGRLVNGYGLTLWALGQLDLMRLLEGEHDYNSELFKDICERGRNPEVSLCLGIKPPKKGHEDENKLTTEYVKLCADLAGIPLKAHQPRREGKRVRVYRLNKEAFDSPIRQDIAVRILSKLKKWQDDAIESMDWDKLVRECESVSIDDGTVHELPPEEIELMEQERISREDLEAVTSLELAYHATGESMPQYTNYGDKPLEEYKPDESIWVWDNGSNSHLQAKVDRVLKLGKLLDVSIDIEGEKHNFLASAAICCPRVNLAKVT